MRDLASAVYEAEARSLLQELDAEFSRWRGGACSSSELLSAIHEFHQHHSRELWSSYQGLSDAAVLERGIGFGFIAENAIPAAILAKLSPWRRTPDEQ